MKKSYENFLRKIRRLHLKKGPLRMRHPASAQLTARCRVTTRKDTEKAYQNGESYIPGFHDPTVLRSELQKNLDIIF